MEIPQEVSVFTPGGQQLGAGIFFLFIGVILFLIAWSIIWKGLALWKSAREGSKGWFIAFLVVNTLGILEILYLYVFSKKQQPIPQPTSGGGNVTNTL